MDTGPQRTAVADCRGSLRTCLGRVRPVRVRNGSRYRRTRISAVGTKLRCRSAPGISEAGGRPAVPSACRPQPPLTHLYGPAARCKRFSSSCRFAVLHQCIRPLIGAFAPGHHGYQRACVLISGQASIGPFGSPVFACAGKTDPPSLLIPLADLGWKRLIGLRHRLLLISPSSFVRA